MAISQRQLAELAQEALRALQAYDQLRTALEETLGQHEVSPEARLALASYILRDQPVVACTRSEQTLAHIERTRKRNEKRAEAARLARQQQKGSER